ncbi:RNA polymerase sigma-70 factor [Streptomyces antibioticus]|uniref:RNA polymerase sigma-70 factor n=1 Tax=Streptomyces antibioticus TaxID=1890 RepID=A0AAE7CJ68_STRAT|nr:RNA polymerase sigma-70 factor [Streptomyces antibioticus]MCX5166475.1 RNA polymerase sigma-70 factor [Streptomyces antibioticus]OOQ54559.1 RNA polymerase subunit sigma-24 [Streptomyces antibioticus]QIT42173.1 RNA polymerase sigma-70 factor [Streptomyces antibioticus]
MHNGNDGGSLEEATREFTKASPRLFGIAYRVLGSAVEAEDVVQEAWLRWQNTDRRTIREPAAFLATVTTRLAINLSQSARMRRESYIGPWLPDPLDTAADPQVGAERAEALDLAVLFLLEKLNAVERAAYVLREAFEYSYKEIAAILETSEGNTRQLVSRARKHLSSERREPVSSDAHRRLLEVFLAAAQNGDLRGLEEVLTTDVVSYADGGGVRGASRIPVFGKEHVSKYLVAFAPRFWHETEVHWVEVNGRPAVLISADGKPMALLCVDASDRGIERIMWVLNPDKLNRYVTSPIG